MITAALVVTVRVPCVFKCCHRCRLCSRSGSGSGQLLALLLCYLVVALVLDLVLAACSFCRCCNLRRRCLGACTAPVHSRQSRCLHSCMRRGHSGRLLGRLQDGGRRAARCAYQALPSAQERHPAPGRRFPQKRHRNAASRQSIATEQRTTATARLARLLQDQQQVVNSCIICAAPAAGTVATAATTEAVLRQHDAANQQERQLRK